MGDNRNIGEKAERRNCWQAAYETAQAKASGENNTGMAAYRGMAAWQRKWRRTIIRAFAQRRVRMAARNRRWRIWRGARRNR